MTRLTIRASRAYMVTSPERRAALQELRDDLDRDNGDVDLEITEYVPGRRGLPPPWTPEDVAIFIGTGVATGLIGAITTDVYSKAKRWAMRQYNMRRNLARDVGTDEGRVKGERFTIFGPDNQPLKTWWVDKDGEHDGTQDSD